MSRSSRGAAPARKVSRLEQLPCPSCGAYLERGRGRHGLVWLCHACRAGAVTLPVLRQVAPRAFVNELWQTALHGGRRSRLSCPACGEPFTELAASRGDAPAPIEVCVRCFWVWLGSSVLSSAAAYDIDAARALTDAAPRARPAAARRALGSLGAAALVAALPRRPPK